MISAFFSEAARDPQLKKVIKYDFDKDCETVESFLEQVRKKGGIGSNVDLRSLSLGFVALAHGYVLQQGLGVGKDESSGSMHQQLVVRVLSEAACQTQYSDLLR